MMLLAGGWKNENLFQLYLFILDLPSFRIHMVTVTVNQFRDGNNFISLPFQVGNQGIQGIRRKFCSVMAQDDGTVSQMLVAAYRVYDGINTVILPVQGIHIPLDRVIAAFRSGLYDIIIIITVRRAEEEDSSLFHVPS